MRKTGLIISFITACAGLAGIGVFISSLDIASHGGSPGDGNPYLVCVLSFIYGIFIYRKILLIKKFTENHKLTLNFLIWPMICTLAVSTWLTINSKFAGEGLGIFIAIVILFAGTFISCILSLVSFVIERNK